MKCQNCQFENSDGMKYCGECGQEIHPSCPHCGFTNPPNFKFCGNCGCALSAGEAKIDIPPQLEEPPISEEHQNENACCGPDSERKCVTVMFSDLTGYTEMSEKLDPEEVKEITSAIFSKFAKIIEKYDGFIEKYIGDAILGVFGAVETFEDSALRAIKAAREMHAHVESVSPKYENRIGRSLSMHTGINTGLVVTGEINFHKGTHGLVGDTINTAARLMSASEAGEIIVDHDSFVQTEGYFEFEVLRSVKVKGKSDPIKIYRVGKALREPRKLHRLHGQRADHIGRSSEIQILKDACERLANGQGGVMGVCGAAGTGKSRLINEFRSSLDLTEIQWLAGNAHPYSKTMPYYPLIDLLTKAFRIGEKDTPAEINKKIEQGVSEIAANKNSALPYIRSLFSIESSEVEKVTPEDWKTKLQISIADIISSIGYKRPTVICLEDLHWADPSFLELLHFIFNQHAIPVLFICAYRPEIEMTNFIGTGSFFVKYTEIKLQNLLPSESLTMIASMLKTSNVPEQLSGFIEKKLGGNPFYIEEFINHLIESEILYLKNSKWEINGKLEDYTIPSTVQGVISARVDRLPKASKRLLQEASVIGCEFILDILSNVTVVNDKIGSHLLALEKSGLITPKSNAPHLEYFFKHGLIQEVVYASLLREEKAAIHDKIGGVIEQLYETRIAEFYELLAYHYQNGRSRPKAIEFLVKSGRKSIAKFAVEASQHYYQLAYEHLSSQESPTDNEQKILIDLLMEWSPVFYFRSDFSSLIDLLKPREATFIEIDDQETLGMYYAWLGHAYGKREELRASYAYLLKALAIGEKLNSRSIVAVACVGLVWTCADMGLLDQAIGYGKRAEKLPEEVKNYFVYNILMTGLALAYYFRGDVEKIFEISAMLLRNAAATNDIRMLSGAYITAGWAYLTAGDFINAIKQLKCLIGTPDPLRYYGGLLFLGYSYLANNQLDEAEQIHREIKTYCESHGAEFIGRVSEGFHGLIQMGFGKLGEGLEIVQNTLEAFKDSGSRYRFANYHYLVGRFFAKLAARSDPVTFPFIIKNIWFLMTTLPVAHKKAEYHFNRAIDVSKEIGAKCITGISLLELGILQNKKGRKRDAQNCIALAIEYFENCGAYAHLNRAKEIIASL